MAEIKSTLDMVMERAAKMCAETVETSSDETMQRNGMRIAASYVNGENVDLMAALKEQQPKDQMAVRSGMVKTLLRNIMLPRDGAVAESALQGLRGIQLLSGNTSDIASLCEELSQILDQYEQHKEQVKQQLDQAILSQLKQKLMAQGQNIDDELLNPAMHPQYREELNRTLSDLNGQYNEALEQRREIIRQRLGG